MISHRFKVNRCSAQQINSRDSQTKSRLELAERPPLAHTRSERLEIHMLTFARRIQHVPAALRQCKRREF